MYLYLYDNFLNAPKYAKTLAKIETRLTDLGIGGKISRLSPLKNIRELIKDEVKNGVKTVVAVGGDKTVIQTVNDIIDLNVTLGIIPIGQGNTIASALGIETMEDAPAILSARKLEKIDVGRANNTYFLSGLSIPNCRVTLECENQYQVKSITECHEITICNLRPAFAGIDSDPLLFNPADGFLEALIRPVKNIKKGLFKNPSPKKNSVFPCKKIHIESQKSQKIYTDGEKILKTPVSVEVVPKKLKIIVGKKRVF